MQATYQQQLAKGTRFATPITDISDLVGGNRPFFYAYVDGPDHALIELNTARHHNFGHVHMFSADPPAAGAWYAKQLGVRSFPQTEKRIYSERADRAGRVRDRGSRQHDHLSRRVLSRGRLEAHRSPTRGRVIDHLGFSVDDLDATLARLRNDGVKSHGRAAQHRRRPDQVRLHRRPGPGRDRTARGRDAATRPRGRLDMQQPAWNFEQDPTDERMDETSFNLRAYFDRMDDDKLRAVLARVERRQLMEWDGNFKSDGDLLLPCSERDVDVAEYRRVIEQCISLSRPRTLAGVKRDSNSSIVYTTGVGERCPNCLRPVARMRLQERHTRQDHQRRRRARQPRDPGPQGQGRDGHHRPGPAAG